MSIDSQKFELEKLQGDMVELKEEHSTALKKKAEEFERWIGQKEQAIEEEVERRKDVEKDLETANVQVADLKKQLEQKDSKITSLEDVVVEEHNRYTNIVNAKKDIESKLATQVRFHFLSIETYSCTFLPRTEVKISTNYILEAENSLSFFDYWLDETYIYIFYSPVQNKRTNSPCMV